MAGSPMKAEVLCVSPTADLKAAGWDIHGLAARKELLLLLRERAGCEWGP